MKMYKSRVSGKVSGAEYGQGKPFSKSNEFIWKCSVMFGKQIVL